jgi:hypothetical protein
MALVEKIVAQGRQLLRGEEAVVLARRTLQAAGMMVFLLEIAVERESRRCCQGL